WFSGRSHAQISPYPARTPAASHRPARASARSRFPHSVRLSRLSERPVPANIRARRGSACLVPDAESCPSTLDPWRRPPDDFPGTAVSCPAGNGTLERPETDDRLALGSQVQVPGRRRGTLPAGMLPLYRTESGTRRTGAHARRLSLVELPRAHGHGGIPSAGFPPVISGHGQQR